MNFPKGSEWRRWDLHVHTKGTNKNDGFKSETFEEFCITFFRKALENNIAAIGITDYFSIENYKNVVQFVNNIHNIDSFSDEEKEKIKKIFLIPNVELRMPPATGSGQLINIHCLFNPDFVDELENHFFNEIHFSGGPGSSLPMNRKGMIDLGRSNNKKLDEIAAYNKGVFEFVVSLDELQRLRDRDKDFKENVIIVVSNSNKDGASGLQNHYKFFEGNSISSLDAVRRSIYMLSDCIFSGNPKDTEYFSGIGKDSTETVTLNCGSLKPCIHGSDAHTEDKLFSPDDSRYCWIKADLTFNGLRQIIYEPNPGERVYIGPTKPDRKDEYKVIKKIVFQNTSEFPREIEFNQNLCSIIGSRSSGKSALLAYVADGLDSEQTRNKKPNGPGEGFPWCKVEFDYFVEWENGKSNADSKGKVVYIPQNFLYGMSEKPEEIKAKILPVLYKKLPHIGANWNKVETEIKRINSEINNLIEKLFEKRDQISEINERLIGLGNEASVKSEKLKTDEEIRIIKEKYKLNEEDLKKLQELSELKKELELRISQLEEEEELLGNDGKEGKYFTKSNISLIPSHENLPENLQKEIIKILQLLEKKAINDLNSIVVTYCNSLVKDLNTLRESNDKTFHELKSLQEKQEKNEELKSLIEKSSSLNSTLIEIARNNKKLEECKVSLNTINDNIEANLHARTALILDLIEEVSKTDQSSLKDMTFGVEAQIKESDIELFQSKLNTRENSRFVQSHSIDIYQIRNQHDIFMEEVYIGEQKLNKNQEKLNVVKEALQITEHILFTANMEGDKIGGFSQPTMTPGKRALFALRLLLAESEDTWPLLIDQPEDDLDSRSIFNDIVPFLREKKKERQIIMVSHNANLVIGADSEQIIVANRHGEDRKNEKGLLFNYLRGSIENSRKHDSECFDTLNSQGVREHACQILEGGEMAFALRSNRYDLNREKR